MPEPFVENLIAVSVGALLGFFASLGFSIWQDYTHKKEYRVRLRQELEIQKKHIQEVIDSGQLVPKAFFHDYFAYTKTILVSKVDAKTWETVLKAYIAIDHLRHNWTKDGKTREETKKEEYDAVIPAIDEAIKNLK